MSLLHIPVMPKEVISALNIAPGGLYLDGTAGLGGHSSLILESGGRAVCVDRDLAALGKCKERLARFGDKAAFHHSNFSDYLINEARNEQFCGILLDLGVSSMQLDTPDRGFSYRHNAPLDMRMDREQLLTAKEIVNTWEYRKLVRILYDYGEERYAPRLAQGIISARPIETTLELSEAVIENMPAKGRREAQHPAKRTFQALRIAVNSELLSLEQALPAAFNALRTGGRLAVISFHSLEDRIVKRAFSAAAKGCDCPSNFPACVCGKVPLVKLLGKSKPEAAEAEENPRSQSATLRVAEKL